MDKKKLAEELLNRIDAEKNKELKPLSNMDKNFLEAFNGMPFEIQGINLDEIKELSGLYLFINAHKELTEKEFRTIIKSKPIIFRFLRKVDNALPDFFETLKNNGVLSTAMYYVNTVFMDACKTGGI